MPNQADESTLENDLLLVVASFRIPFAEALYTTGGIDDLLLTRIEGVAVGADFNVQLIFGRPGIDHVATKTGDRAVDIFRMYVLFHFSSTF